MTYKKINNIEFFEAIKTFLLIILSLVAITCIGKLVLEDELFLQDQDVKYRDIMRSRY